MKNLKKVLALVVALTMVLGTVAFASFTDVAEDHDAFTAVQTLSSLGILNGYEDGSFKPEGDITRAEFCAVVCRALGLEGSANGAKGATQFTDVAADHWASGYINLAAGQKIVNGMGDGTFAPESNVTFEQAVKMLVVALGFEPMAAQKGGYPTGYLVVANTYGMTDGVKASDQTAAASRGIVAQLTYNALDIPVMKQTGFGANTEYTIMDGNNDYEYESLLTNLGVAKLEGVVTGTAVIGGDVEVGQVKYAFNEANDDPDWTEYLEDNEDEDTGFADYDFYVAEGVNAEDYFGVATIAYVREMSKNKYEIVAIMPNDDSEMIVLGSEDLDDETTDATVVYYPTKDSKKTEKVKLDSPVIFANYINVTSKGFKDAVEDLTGDVEITLVENTGDSKFDMVILKAYNYALVDEVEAEKDRFTTAGVDGRTYTFDFEDEDISNKIVNKDGDAITLADFAENDVVAILTEDGENKNFAWAEVINLGQNAVEGTVTEVDDEEIYIDGTAYEVVGEMPKLGDEGAFFLTTTGKVFYFDLSASVSGNYGYILELALNDSGFSEVWQIKLLTKENGIVVYDVDDKFKMNGVSLEGDMESDTPNITEAQKKEIAKIEALVDGDHKDDVEARLVTYKLDSNNYIKEINSVNTADVAAESEYNADAQSIDKKALEDDTVIFNVSNSSINSAYKTDINALVDEAKYEGIVAINDDAEYDCFVVLVGGSKIDAASDIAVVESVTDITTEDDEEAIKVRYYISNEDDVKELVIVDDEEISEGYWESDITDVKKGAIIMFTADEAGVASAFAVLANVTVDDKDTEDVDESNKWEVNDKALEELSKEDDDNEFVIGAIYDWDSKNAGKVITYNEAGDVVTVRTATNKYTVDNTRRTWAIDVQTWDGGDVDKADDEGTNYFFARLYNGTVADFVTIGDRAAALDLK